MRSRGPLDVGESETAACGDDPATSHRVSARGDLRAVGPWAPVTAPSEEPVLWGPRPGARPLAGLAIDQPRKPQTRVR